MTPERERLVAAEEEAAEMYDASDFSAPHDYARETKRTAHLLADARAALAAYDRDQEGRMNSAYRHGGKDD